MTFREFATTEPSGTWSFSSNLRTTTTAKLTLQLSKAFFRPVRSVNSFKPVFAEVDQTAHLIAEHTPSLKSTGDERQRRPKAILQPSDKSARATVEGELSHSRLTSLKLAILITRYSTITIRKAAAPSKHDTQGAA